MGRYLERVEHKQEQMERESREREKKEGCVTPDDNVLCLSPVIPDGERVVEKRIKIERRG